MRRISYGVYHDPRMPIYRIATSSEVSKPTIPEWSAMNREKDQDYVMRLQTPEDEPFKKLRDRFEPKRNANAGMMIIKTYSRALQRDYHLLAHDQCETHSAKN